MTSPHFVPLAVPDLGAEARVSGWLVERGESVRQGDRLVELLLPGVVYDVSATATGRLFPLAKPGSRVRTGDRLGVIEREEDPPPDASQSH